MFSVDKPVDKPVDKKNSILSYPQFMGSYPQVIHTLFIMFYIFFKVIIYYSEGFYRGKPLFSSFLDTKKPPKYGFFVIK